MPAEVGPACLGNFNLGSDNAVIGRCLDTSEGPLDILDSSFHVTFNIEGETRGLGDGETEIKSDNTGNASKTNEETPAVVNSVGFSRGIAKDGALVGVDDDKGDEAGSWKDF